VQRTSTPERFIVEGSTAKRTSLICKLTTLKGGVNCLG
jgi:hypothetical protein